MPVGIAQGLHQNIHKVCILRFGGTGFLAQLTPAFFVVAVLHGVRKIVLLFAPSDVFFALDAEIFLIPQTDADMLLSLAADVDMLLAFIVDIDMLGIIPYRFRASGILRRRFCLRFLFLLFGIGQCLLFLQLWYAFIILCHFIIPPFMYNMPYCFTFSFYQKKQQMTSVSNDQFAMQTVSAINETI